MDMETLHVVNNKEDEAINESIQMVTILPSSDSPFNAQKQHHVNMMESGPPHGALFFVLAYLPLFELLAISEVCKLLKDAVNKDVLLWLDIIVDRPLNLGISDELLVKITSKANGRLRSLVLINCVRITDDGLLRVVEKNPFINKLHIPACTGLTTEGVIQAVKSLTQQNHNLKSLRINGICNIKKEHLEMLHLQMNPAQQETYSTIDMDICPKCSEVRMIFDCPREICTSKRGQPLIECRACNICIPRCKECGRCVEFEELGDTVCNDILCLDCWLQLPKCNFCNKPYCKHHANQQCSSPGSTGWICGVCHVKFQDGNLHD